MKLKILTILILCSAVLFGQDIFNGRAYFEEEKIERKSLSKAIALSVLIPGAGEIFLDSPRSGYPLIAAEGVIWTSGAVFFVQHKWRNDRSKWYAARYADANPNIKDDDYYKIVGLYPSRKVYNLILQQMGYNTNDLLEEEYNWEWLEESQQIKFYDLWTSFNRSKRNFEYAIGAAILNRLVSVLNVLRIHRYGPSKVDINARATTVNDNNIGISIMASYEF